MRYDIRVTGDWTERSSALFGDVEVTRTGASTTISGQLDQAALYGVLQRVRLCGLTLVDVRRRRRGVSRDEAR